MVCEGYDPGEKGSNHKAMMDVAQYILEAFVKESIKHIFLIPGGLVEPFLPAFVHCRTLTPIVAARESGAAFMADGYARATGHFGVCLGIGGPGVANMVSASLTALSDQSCVLLIGGEVATNWEGLGVFQDASPIALDDHSIMQRCTLQSIRVEKSTLFAHHFQKAVGALFGLRRGPVYLSIPVDVQKEKIQQKYIPLEKAFYSLSCVDEESIEDFWMFIQEKSPLYRIAILADKNVEHAGGEQYLEQVAQKYAIPVATTLHGKGVFSEDHEYSLGVFGYGGTMQATEALLSDKLDVLIVLGCGLSQRDTMFWSRKFNPKKALIEVDSHSRALGKNYEVDLAVVSDAKSFLQKVLSASESQKTLFKKGISQRKKWMESIRKTDRLYDEKNCYSDRIPISPAKAIFDLCQVMPSNTNLVVDSGANRVFASHYWKSVKPHQFFSATHLGSMGWAVAAGIGIKLAKPKSPCVVVTGDGCMQMEGMEIQTAARYQVAVIFVVLNNAALGNVYLRAKAYGKLPREMTSLPDHDWAGFARSLGMESQVVKKPQQLTAAYKKALRAKRPFLIEIKCDKDQKTPIEPYAESKKSWFHD